MNTRLLDRSTIAFASAAMALAFTVSAAEFIVGPGHYESLQAAVDAAADAANLDVENFITIREPVLFTSARVRIGAEFNAAKHLVVRPDPSGPDMSRVTIVSQNGFEEIILIEGAGHVTVQDLDLIRHTTNFENLMKVQSGTEIVVERCRVGSDWPTASIGEWSNLVIDAPRHVVVRNCIIFARLPGNLARGIAAVTGTAQNHSIFLYNNVVADHARYGIEISAHGDSFVLLRNNVVFNHISLAPEPTAYHSLVNTDVMLVTSHNTALAAAANVEVIEANGLSIAGAGSFVRLERADHIRTFREFEWKTDLGWNQNRNLFRLIHGGLLQNSESDAGVTVWDGVPHGRDAAVLDDWELDPRPAGDPARTDRGADQFRQFTIGDVEVFRPRFQVFTGISIGNGGTAEEIEVVAVGPQDDFPEIPETMRGGEFLLAGGFVSIGTPRLVGFNELRLIPSPAPGGRSLVIAWPKTVRAVSVEETADLTAPAWNKVTVQPVATGETIRVTLPLAGPQRFFRLRH